MLQIPIPGHEDKAEKFNGRHYQIAEMLLDRQVVTTSFKDPFTLQPGLLSPVHCKSNEIPKYDDVMELLVTHILDNPMRWKKDNVVVSNLTASAIPYVERISKSAGLSAYLYHEDRPALKDSQDPTTRQGARGMNILDEVTVGADLFVDRSIFFSHEAEMRAFPIISFSIFSYSIHDKLTDWKNEDGRRRFYSSFMPYFSVWGMLPLFRQRLSDKEYHSLESWMKDPLGWKPL